MERLGVTSDQSTWSPADSGWLGVRCGEGGLFGRARVLFSVVSSGAGCVRLCVNGLWEEVG